MFSIPNVCFRFFVASLLVFHCLATPTTAYADSISRFHPGDKLSVDVFNHPELSSSPTVDGMGNIGLPLIGSTRAQGESVDSLRTAIELKLRHFVIKPAVDVALESVSTSVFFVGPIAGVVPYFPGETLVTALAHAQSLQAPSVNAVATAGQTSTSSPTLDLRALRESSIDLRQVVIRRDNTDLSPVNIEQLVADGASGPVLAGGDIIALRERPIAVKISGLVAHPLIAHLYADEPLVSALRQAGGVDETTALYKLILVRDGKLSEITRSSAEMGEPAITGDELRVPIAPRIMVAGQVNKPGPILAQGDRSLLNAIYDAGGPTTEGDLRRVAILRGGRQTRYNLTVVRDRQLVNNPILEDGDSIFIPQARGLNFAVLFQGLFAISAYRSSVR